MSEIFNSERMAQVLSEALGYTPGAKALATVLEASREAPQAVPPTPELSTTVNSIPDGWTPAFLVLSNEELVDRRMAITNRVVNAALGGDTETATRLIESLSYPENQWGVE
jgi:hypothetical protein